MFTSTSEKRLVTKKLKPNKSSNLILTVNELFNNPLNYFINELPNQRILFNQQFNKSRHATIPIPSQISREKSREFRGKMIGSIFARSSSLRNFISTRPREINDEELNRIYSKYRTKQIKYFKSSGNMFSEHDNICHLFNKQQHILKGISKAQEQNHEIIHHLCNKTKRNQEQLVISKSSYYRLKKEVINDLDNEIQSRNPMPYLKWAQTLRNKNNTSTDSMIILSVDKPQNRIQFSDTKFSEENLIKPHILNKKQLKEMKRFLNNSYLKKKISVIGHKLITKKIELSETMNLVEVKGNDLLGFEKKLSESLKGRKLLTHAAMDSDSNLPVIIKKHKDFPLRLIKSKH